MNLKPGKHIQATRQRVGRIFLIQTLMVVIMAVIFLFYDLIAAYSVLLGGVIYLLPNSYFAWRILFSQQNGSPNRALADMYIGQIWKMAISIVCFSAVFILVRPLSPFSLFVTFILLQISGWYLQMKVNNRFLKL
ncbi:ATP synthase subunit I [Neptunomonas antarctica]|uniref:ATP synthase protein I n=1 Tax=Neptunomonas antarctica TaxID=619304 RepID=A0A1N7IST5_9GAMM|nr:ATP synthase subunit I [Neptunomonas antarctica]SIS40066.1 ATP synthase protein I [Neptunomonas antarctica]